MYITKLFTPFNKYNSARQDKLGHCQRYLRELVYIRLQPSTAPTVFNAGKQASHLQPSITSGTVLPT